MAKKPRQKIYWMSRDVVGAGNQNVYFWKNKPMANAGEFSSKDGKASDELGNFSDDCTEFSQFCHMFSITPPKPGQLFKLTIDAQVVEELSSGVDVANRLRAAKRFDKALMVEAAAWVDSATGHKDDDDVNS